MGVKSSYTTTVAEMLPIASRFSSFQGKHVALVLTEANRSNMGGGGGGVKHDWSLLCVVQCSQLYCTV